MRDTSPLNFANLMHAAIHFLVESLIIAPNPEHCLFISVVTSTLIFSHPWGGGVHAVCFVFHSFFLFRTSGNCVLLKALIITSALAIDKLGSNFSRSKINLFLACQITQKIVTRSSISALLSFFCSIIKSPRISRLPISWIALSKVESCQIFFTALQVTRACRVCSTLFPQCLQ